MQPGGQIRGLPDDRPLAGFSLTGQFADHYRAGCDADPSGKRYTTQIGKGRDRLGHPKPRANCTLRLIFMCTRPAEVRKDAVAQELGYVALEPGDLPHHPVVVGLHEITHRLRVAP